VFCKIISHVEASRSPVDIEVQLCNAILGPVILHVKSFGPFHTNLGFENVMCRGVVSQSQEVYQWVVVCDPFLQVQCGLEALPGHRNKPPVSASAAEAGGTPQMVLHRTWTGPLGLELGGSLVGMSLR
jgi:hypothetical protein